jgi:predicted ATP-dependent endonuclease of OLD family
MPVLSGLIYFLHGAWLELIDEPEISLHIDWQQRLIDLIRQLNPNAQIILSTHSPALIMDGWMENVTEVGDISN